MTWFDGLFPAVVAAVLAGVAVRIAVPEPAIRRLGSLARASLPRAGPRLLPRPRGSVDQRAQAREASEVLAVELRAGRSSGSALERAGDVCSQLTKALETARLRGDIASALVEAGPVLRPVAIAWRVAERTGAGLADLIDRVVETMREDDEIRREVSAQLAGPRTTARLLAALPVAGLVLGGAFGADSFGFLLGTPYGLACLGAALALSAVGLAWVERLARRAERR